MSYSKLLQTFAKRLRQARAREKISMDELCERMDGKVSKQSISKYERGIMMPSNGILQKLANSLHVDVEYLLRPFAFDLGQVSMSFRKKASMGKKDVLALQIQIQDEIERRIKIDEIMGCKPPKVPPVVCGVVSDIEDIIGQAEWIRNYCGLGIAPIVNVIDFLEQWGVKVILTDAPAAFDGLSGKFNDNQFFIVLNRNTTNIERRRLTALHEACHLLFHEKFSPDLTPREVENLCNTFANEFLFPRSVARDIVDTTRPLSLDYLILIQRRYGISVDAIMFKLHQMAMIDDRRYRNFCIRKSTNPKFKHAVETSLFKEFFIDVFEAQIYDALNQQLITTALAAELMKCDVEEVKSHRNSL